jgi:hypothetical protein
MFQRWLKKGGVVGTLVVAFHGGPAVALTLASMVVSLSALVLLLAFKKDAYLRVRFKDMRVDFERLPSCPADARRMNKQREVIMPTPPLDH